MLEVKFKYHDNKSKMAEFCNKFDVKIGKDVTEEEIKEINEMARCVEYYIYGLELCYKEISPEEFDADMEECIYTAGLILQLVSWNRNIKIDNLEFLFEYLQGVGYYDEV